MDIMFLIIFIAAVVYLIETLVKIYKHFIKGYEDNNHESSPIEQIMCKNCNKNYDIDFPKCPYCKNINE